MPQKIMALLQEAKDIFDYENGGSYIDGEYFDQYLEIVERVIQDYDSEIY